MSVSYASVVAEALTNATGPLPKRNWVSLNLLSPGYGSEEGRGEDCWVEDCEEIIEVYETSTTFRSLCGLTSHITELDLSGEASGGCPYRNLLPVDAMLLAAELKKGVTTGSLRTLRLDGNSLAGRDRDRQIEPGHKEDDDEMEGIKALLEAVQVNTTLQCLFLKDNWLGPESASALAAVVRHGTLRTLDLSGTPRLQIRPL